MATILEDLRAGFFREFDEAVPDAAITLMYEGHSGLGNWRARRDAMVQKFMGNYGAFLVNGAMGGLTDERIALLVAQEYPRLSSIQLSGVGMQPTFSTCVSASLRSLFSRTVQQVILDRVEEWAEGEGVADGAELS